MNIKIGNYQAYWLDVWGIQFCKHETSLKYILSWTLLLGKIGIHKYITEERKKELFKRDSIK